MAGSVRGMAAVGAGILVLALAAILATEGITASRLGLFGLIAIAAGLGEVGAIRDSPLLIGFGGAVLLALGFWQAAIGVFVVPLGLLLVVATLLSSGPIGRIRPASA